jgi:Ca-activated chloride channel family protein
MQGASIDEAKNALQLCLRSLRPGCTFNVVGFGSRYQSLFPKSRAYDDASLAEAAKHVRELDADLGGTEILPALEHVLAAKPLEGLPRQVFVLTDGEVSNTDEVIALGRQHAGHARIFTFGIGAGASHHLVKGLARAGEGEAEFIAPGERIEAKVLRQLSRALAPALSDVQVDWAGLDATQAPHEVPPVFADGRVLLFGQLAKLESASVTLRAVAKDGPVSFAVPVDPQAAAEGTLVGTLWARRTIRDLEEGRSDLHPRRGSKQARALGLKDERVKAEIVSLGTAWSLVSRHTSFVAVEERETPTEGEAQLRKIPVAITKGWHGVGDVRFAASSSAMLMRTAARVCGPTSSYDVTQDMPLEMAAGFLEEAAPLETRSIPAPRMASIAPGVGGALRRMLGLPRPAATRSAPSTRPLDRLVALQGAHGAWLLDDELAKALGWKNAKQLRKAFGRPLVGEPEERAAATALALRWLERECADSRDEWRILADKGREWLSRTPEGADEWLRLASDALARQ